MKTTKGLLLCLFLSLTALGFAADHVKGNGTVEKKNYKLEDFNEIKIDGFADVTYTQNDKPTQVDITLDENLHQYLKLDIDDRVLTIGFDKKVKVDQVTKFSIKLNSAWLKKVRISGNANFMTSNDLKGDELEIKANGNCLVQLFKTAKIGLLTLDVAGSANMVADNIIVKNFECKMDGSGSIRLKNGKAESAKYSITGSGDIHAFGVAIPNVVCKITGSGMAEIHPTDHLEASIIGKGNIRYKGPTAVQQKVLGKGTIQEVK